MSNNLRSRMGHIVAVFALLAAGALTATPALAAEGEGCPNEQVRHESNVNPATGQPYSLGLPECRAYEMVSPLEKQAHEANVGLIGPLVSPNGEAVEYVSEGAFAGTENYLVTGIRPHISYIARRAVNGWVTEPALVPASVISQPTPKGFAGDASLDVTRLATCGYVGYTNDGGQSGVFACAARDASGTWTETPLYDNLNGLTGSNETILWGGANNLTDIVWESPAGTELLPGGENEAGSGAIYETTGLGTGSVSLRMVSVNNEGTPLGTQGGKAGPYLGGARWYPEVQGSAYHAISSDGQTVYFTAEPVGGGGLTLYARTGDFAGGTSALPTTVAIAEDANYVGASADGSRVFFTTTQPLVSADTDSTADLYEYNFDAPAGQHYTDISAGGLGDPSPGSGAIVESRDVVGVASDGSHIYFTSGAILTSIPNGIGGHASQGGANLYGYDTEKHETQFVASTTVVQGQEINEQQAQVTPNGRYLVFASPTNLSSENGNVGAGIYRYDFQTGGLTWVSHSAPGFAATNEGDSAVLPPFEAAKEGANADFSDLRRAISESGEYVVFRTKEKLQANDVNIAPDVYLWHNGEVHMISDGINHEGVTEVVGMSATGSDIVFGTASKLVGQDKDELQDIYDARVDGGFSAPTPEPSCSGEACQGNPSSAPTFGAPGTVSFTVGGNQTSPPFKEVLEAEPKPKSKLLTNTQKLAKSLKLCKRDKSVKRRKACEAAARKRFAGRGPRRK